MDALGLAGGVSLSGGDGGRLAPVISSRRKASSLVLVPQR